MKKLSKIFTILLIVAMVMTMLTTIVNAGGATGETGGKDDSSSVIDIVTGGGSADTEQLQNVGASIVDIITTVGIIVAVVVLLILGIKYMMGSAAEKAEYKKTMIPYLVGAVLIFGASAIAKAVVAMSESITGTAA